MVEYARCNTCLSNLAIKRAQQMNTLHTNLAVHHCRIYRSVARGLAAWHRPLRSPTALWHTAAHVNIPWRCRHCTLLASLGEQLVARPVSCRTSSRALACRSAPYTLRRCSHKCQATLTRGKAATCHQFKLSVFLFNDCSLLNCP
jgi:hypothetical protein